MKNPAPYIRKALFFLLDGAVAYDGVIVPVYEGEGNHSDPYQILIAEQTDTDRNTKHNFGSNFTQLIEIVAEKHTGIRKDVDAIGDMVMNLIKPTPRGTGLTIDPSFQIVNVKRTALNYIQEDSGSGTKIMRLLLRYSFIIIETT